MYKFLSWWNYRTQQFEHVDALSFTDVTVKDYMPQIPAAFGLYDTYRAMGKSILNALSETLLACLPEHMRK